MARVTAEIRGLKELQRDLDKIAAATAKAVAKATYELASEIMAEAKRLAPLDEGTLQNSGYVTLPNANKANGGYAICELGFGGAAEAYALKQHEDTSLHHPEPGRQAKYLEQPFNARRGELAGRVSAAVDAAMKAGAAPSISAAHPTAPKPAATARKRQSKKNRKRPRAKVRRPKKGGA